MFLKFAVPYLPRFQNLPAELRFMFRAESVQSARVLRWDIWPGAIEIQPGMTAEEMGRVRAGHRAKWREQSGSWDEFERWVLRNEEPPVVSAAMLAMSSGERVLKAGLNIREGEYVELVIRSEGLSVFRTDGGSIDLDQFKRLGEEYWDERSGPGHVRSKNPSGERQI